VEPLVFALVLLAAALHAAWNALVKLGGDPFVRLAMVNLAGGVCALPLLPFAGLPTPASWPYLLGSIVAHHAYYLALAYGYRFGDLSHVYPIARGSAPPLVALGAWLFAGELPAAAGVVAVLLVCAGITSLAFDRGNRQVASAPVLWGLATGAAIAAYTVFDGLGGRASGAVVAYILWLFVLDAVPFTLLVAWRRRRRLRAEIARNWRGGTLGGALSFGAYALVIWAMSLGPMAPVSALRETSVIMAAWLGTRVLGEPFGRRRLKAAATVVAGVILLQASGAG